MPEPLELITDSNQEDDDEILSTLAEIAERTRRMEEKFDRLFGAWSTGGLRGLRAAAKGATNGG